MGRKSKTNSRSKMYCKKCGGFIGSEWSSKARCKCKLATGTPSNSVPELPEDRDISIKCPCGKYCRGKNCENCGRELRK